jgi:hypothetical protein
MGSMLESISAGIDQADAGSLDSTHASKQTIRNHNELHVHPITVKETYLKFASSIVCGVWMVWPCLGFVFHQLGLLYGKYAMPHKLQRISEHSEGLMRHLSRSRIPQSTGRS